MIFDLNKAVSEFKPWDFTIKWNGVDYKTRAWTLTDRAKAEVAVGVDALRSLVLDLCIDPKLPVDEFTQEVAEHFLQAILGYKEAIARKNSQRIANEVAVLLKAQQ